MELIKTPKQTRSQDTQERLITAAEELLQTKVWEQITIRDIATSAQVSPATIYRRFRDRDALLPIMYARFGKRLNSWATQFWDDYVGADRLHERLRHLVVKHIEFYRRDAPLLRTIYLHNRLHGGLPDPGDDRQVAYVALLEPILGPLSPSPSENRVKLFILILLTTLNERLLFSNVTPASLLELNDAAFVAEMTRVLESCLIG